MAHQEEHRSNTNWLRAAVLGADDGLISTGSLVVGMAAANAGRPTVLLAALAGMVGGALSMAAGEYVSVSSQADAEKADVQRERRELADSPDAEKTELADAYAAQGLDAGLASQVADSLTSHDVLDSHTRDEFGMHEATRARPLQAALASALSFALGAALPVAFAAFLPLNLMTWVVVGGTVLLLLVLGAVAANLGGASIVRGALRVAFWGAVAMGATALVGRLFGTIA
jgi:VIT1/CCC1 family predicted Fe2+/Mn2+ transporter